VEDLLLKDMMLEREGEERARGHHVVREEDRARQN
jgi:hypothetical protein